MSKDLRFTKGEEIANAISHGIGAAFAIVATVLMVVFSVRYGNTWLTVSTSVFGTTLIILYLSSTLNHSLAHGKTKDFFHNFDQIAIYLLIAGTYTPIALSGIRHDWGWVMFSLEWAMALAGILVKTFIPNKFERGVNTFIVISYIFMGWLLLFFLIPIFNHLPKASIVLLFSGGISYSLGVVFFKMTELNYSHLIWHLMVIGGSVCHWVAILLIIFNKV